MEYITTLFFHCCLFRNICSRSCSKSVAILIGKDVDRSDINRRDENDGGALGQSKWWATSPAIMPHFVTSDYCHQHWSDWNNYRRRIRNTSCTFFSWTNLHLLIATFEILACLFFWDVLFFYAQKCRARKKIGDERINGWPKSDANYIFNYGNVIDDCVLFMMRRISLQIGKDLFSKPAIPGKWSAFQSVNI